MPLSAFGASITQRLAYFGRFLGFAGSTGVALAQPARTWLRWGYLGPQLYFIGSKSVPVIALTGAFIGAILAIEGLPQFRAFALESRLGGVVNISVAKQIGPVLAAVMLAGRVGCSLAAELGSMRVTDQLDAMRVLGVSPVRVLAAPRVAACVLMIPVLTVVSNLCGVAGGWLMLVPIAGVANDEYWQFTEQFIGWFDVANGLIKSVFFGFAIGIIACYKGFHCRAGAVGVGRATTEAFVTSFVAIVIINFVLAKLLNDIDRLFISGGLTPFF
jgi:phospholipid/cholesterol/gamma-HCH transport system permease protein